MNLISMNKANVLLTGIGDLRNHLLPKTLLRCLPESSSIFFSGINPLIDPQEKVIQILYSPANSEPNYVKWLKKIISYYEITDIIPGIDSEVEFLSLNRDDFDDVHLWIAERKTVEICVDKWSMYRHAMDLCPLSWSVQNPSSLREVLNLQNPNSEIRVVKPSYGPNGSGKGIRFIDQYSTFQEAIFKEKTLSSRMKAEEYIEFYEKSFKDINIPPLIVSEYLPGEEYSIYVCANKGRMIHCTIHLKISNQTDSTSSGEAVSIESAECENFAREICSRFTLHLLSNIQVRRNASGILKLIEINPRIAGSQAFAEYISPGFIQSAFAITRGTSFQVKSKSIDKRTRFKMTRVTHEMFFQHEDEDSEIITFNSRIRKTKKRIDYEFLQKFDSIIFDLDGTLYDEHRMFRRIITRFMKIVHGGNIKATSDALEAFDYYFLRFGNSNIFDDFLIKHAQSQSDLMLFLDLLANEIEIGIQLFPSAKKLLKMSQELRKNIWIFTDGEDSKQNIKISSLGIAEYFPESQVICSGKSPKPSTDSFLDHIKNTSPLNKIGSSIVFGNSMVDFEFSQRLGATFAVLTESGKFNLPKSLR
jgi:carbamoyl-phosphate synthase large subunit